MVRVITPEVKAAVAKALKGMEDSPAWDYDFYLAHRADITSLLFYDQTALLSAKKHYRPSFLEKILNRLENKELVEIFLSMSWHTETASQANFRAAYRDICSNLLILRIYNRTTKEQLVFIQTLLANPRGDQLIRVYVLAKILLKIMWSRAPVTKTMDFLLRTLDDSAYPTREMVNILQELVQVMLADQALQELLETQT